MTYSPITIWLCVGIFFLIIELGIVPAIGFLFLSFGALTTSCFIYIHPILTNYQVTAFGLFSFLWFLILWLPLKTFKTNNRYSRNYFELKGMQVKVLCKPIEVGEIGQVSWSDTIMNAKLDDLEQKFAEVNELLYIVEIKGNILICSRKKLT